MSVAAGRATKFKLSVMAVVLIVRTYAVWKRDKRVGIGLALLFILCQTAVGIITQKWLAAVHCGYCVDSLFFPHSTPAPASAKPYPLARQNPYPEILLGCYYDSGTRLMYLHWVVLTVEEAGTLRITQSQGLSLIDAGTAQSILF